MSFRICVVVFLMLVTGLVFAADIPAPSPELSTEKSRYIFMPPIDDGGKSSGSHAVTICLPAGYDATDRRYPVFYVLDGESTLLTRQNDMRGTIAYELIADQLVHEGLIEPVIFVAIHNSRDAAGKSIPGNRAIDYCIEGQTYKQRNMVEGGPVSEEYVEKISPSKSEGYYRYLAQTIKPMIDKTYRTRTDPASTGVTGFSAGGAGAFWMTYMHPETFGMGICQSPPFRAPYVGKEFEAILYNDKLPLPKSRIWIDAGSREYDFIYKDTYAGYRKLVARGFVPNDNIAFFTGHNHGHEKFDCTRRLRSALYFMLRTKKPVLTGVEITDMDAETSGPLNLTRPAHVILETVYDGWLRLTDANNEFKISNGKIVSIDNTTNEIRPKSAGHTTITAEYNGKKISQTIEIAAQKAQQPCYAAKKAVTIDGDFSDWSNLSVSVDKPLNSFDASLWKNAADLSYQFDCKYDADYLYIAVRTTDDFINSVPDKDPWFQDGVEIRLDARPEANRLFGQGKEFQDILLVAISPAKAGETRAAYNAAKLPAGIKVICTAVTAGHNTEIAIPIAYINEKADKPWTGIRLNVVVNDLDDDYKGYRGDKIWWQPDWRTPDSTWGAGSFIKK